MNYDSIPEAERKKMLDKFKTGGGKVLSDKELKRLKYKELLQKQRNISQALRVDHEKPKIFQKNKVQKNPNKVISGFFSLLPIYVRCYLSGITPLIKDKIKNKFFRYLITETDNTLLSFQSNILQIFLADRSLQNKIIESLDNKNPAFIGILEYAFEIHQKIDFEALKYLLEQYNEENIPFHEVIPLVRDLYVQLHLGRNYKELMIKAFKELIDISIKKDKLYHKIKNRSMIYQFRKEIANNVHLIFDKIFINLFLLICRSNKTYYENFLIKLEDGYPSDIIANRLRHDPTILTDLNKMKDRIDDQQNENESSPSSTTPDDDQQNENESSPSSTTPDDDQQNENESSTSSTTPDDDQQNENESSTSSTTPDDDQQNENESSPSSTTPDDDQQNENESPPSSTTPDDEKGKDTSSSMDHIYTTKEYQYGLELMKSLTPIILRKNYDPYSQLNIFSNMDKAFLTYLYHEEFDAEYAFLLTTKQIELRPQLIEGNKIDFAYNLMNIHDKYRNPIKKMFNEYHEEVTHLIKTLDQSVNKNYAERSRIKHIANQKITSISVKIRILTQEYMEGVFENMAHLINDMKTEKKILVNMDSTVTLMINTAKKLHDKKVKDCIIEVYCYSLAFKELLKVGNFLGGSLSIEEEECEKFYGQVYQNKETVSSDYL